MEPIMAFPKYLGSPGRQLLKWKAIANAVIPLAIHKGWSRGEQAATLLTLADHHPIICKIAQLPSEGFWKIGRVTILKIPWSLTLAWTYSTLRESISPFV